MIITLEVILQIAFCLLSVHLMSSGRLKRSVIWGYRILRWFPGVLIFGVLFSFLVYLILLFRVSPSPWWPGVPPLWSSRS